MVELVFDILIVVLQSATIAVVWRDHRGRSDFRGTVTKGPPPRVPVR
jgi:hypothetical protein